MGQDEREHTNVQINKVISDMIKKKKKDCKKISREGQEVVVYGKAFKLRSVIRGIQRESQHLSVKALTEEQPCVFKE